MNVLVGAVFQLYQGDLDLGRLALERLVHEGVWAEDFSYGAVAVAMRLEELRPDKLVLVGGERRGREPGTVERRPVARLPSEAAEVQLAVADAVTGYVGIDLVVEVAHGLGALPAHTVAVEVEPATIEPSDRLSAAAVAGLEEALRLVRDEVQAGSSSPRF